MEAYFSEEVRAGLAMAKAREARKQARLRVHVDGQTYPVLELRADGFTVDAAATPHLRGVIDIYDSARHLARCLIVRSRRDGAGMRYEFKRRTAVVDEAALDYARAPDAPVALLR